MSESGSIAVRDQPLAGPDHPWSRDPGSLAVDLDSDPEVGLAESEAERRLAQGRNVLPVADPPTITYLILVQLRDTMIVVLVLAAAFTAAIGDLGDTAIIAVVVALNTALGVAQQRRAQRAIAALSGLTSPTAQVVRAGRAQVVDGQLLVPGDVVLLEAGDLVPADGRLVEAEGLEADEAPLTGESQPAAKTVPSCPAGALVADRSCMLHAGTTVTRGRARLLVTSTGGGSQVGRLAHLLVTSVTPPTPLQQRLARFGRQVAVATVALCLVVLAIGLLQGQPIATMGLTAISLAVAAIPESLPAVLVLSLALSAQRMARKGAVVRILPAVEALGAVTVLASDKTGTLTEGTMLATALWTRAGPVTVDGHGYQPEGRLTGEPDAVDAVGPLLRTLALCNDAHLTRTDGEWTVVGDPMEGALLSLAEKGGQSTRLLRAEWPRLTEYSFDHTRARMTTVHRSPAGTVTVLCKGAPEVLLDLVLDEPSVVDLARAQLGRLTAQGLRVLAVAHSARTELPADAGDAESGLQLLGLVALHDPPRAAAKTAIARCRAAGVRTIMITGDHPTTAAAIAADLGILEPGGRVVTGQDLTAGFDQAALAQVQVFARIAPEQKLAIVEALRAADQVVAMTGDGVNDAPALRRADVGVAMGHSGTEVARQAADVVLMDDNIGTLVVAIAEGRRVYDNVRRFLFYALAGGSSEVLLMLAGPAFGLPLPLLPGQILWVNLLTHGLPGVALGAELAEDGTLDRAPRDPRQGVLGGGLLRRILLLGLLVGSVSLAVGVWAEQARGPQWQSMVFVTLTLQQLGIAVVLRSQTRSALTLRLRGNPFLLWSLVLNGFLLALAVFWTPLAGLLGTRSLTAGEVGICLAAATVAPLALELTKAYSRRQHMRRNDG